jgi:hypothetical protein
MRHSCAGFRAVIDNIMIYDGVRNSYWSKTILASAVLYTRYVQIPKFKFILRLDIGQKFLLVSNAYIVSPFTGP